MAGQTNGVCLLSAQGGVELQYRYLERVMMHMLIAWARTYRSANYFAGFWFNCKRYR